MKKYIMSLMGVLLAVSLCACSVEEDEKDLSSLKPEKEETQILDDSDKELTTEVDETEKSDSESESDEPESESESESDSEYPGADVVELVNLRGDETTVYKLADGTYMDRIERRFIYNGTDIWTDEDGVEWNEVVK